MNIPVKSSVKYLGIFVTKNVLERQNLHFSSRLKKTKLVINCWLQRDLSIYGRGLLSKAEGLSRFVYPALSLHVNDSNCKDINHLFLSFIWKNKSQRLKKRVLTNKKAEGGLEMLYFEDINKTFKINWLKRCWITPNSLWNHIPHSRFIQIGGLKFLLTCDYNISKISSTSSFRLENVLLSQFLSSHLFHLE